MGDHLPPQCIKITKQFMDDKLSGFFIEPFHDPDKAVRDDYYSIIKKPMDLSTIMKKLKENNYVCISDWSNDMNLIFDNAIKYNTDKTLIGNIAIYLKRKLEKKIKNIENLNSRNYEDQIINFTLELNQTLLNPPESISVETDDQSTIEKLEEFSTTRINELKNKLESLIKDNKEDQIIKCLNDAGNNFAPGKKQQIDVAKLGRNSLLKLEELCNQ